MNNQDNSTSKNTSTFMTFLERIISPFLIASVREDFVNDLWEYHYELQHQKLNRLNIIRTILLETISFVRLSTEIYFQDVKRRKRFNPNAEALLRSRFMKSFENMIKIPEFITWGEYELFLDDQISDRFHSQATLPKQSKTGNEPVKGISKSDAYWFCGWLSARACLHPESPDKLYDFRFNLSVEGLKVTRVEIPSNYKKLHQHLSYGAWYEADLEYSRQTLVLSSREEFGYLAKGDFLKIPHVDAEVIDNLWLNFSGGKFGFTPQTVIYQQCEDKLKNHKGDTDYEDMLDAAYEKEIGWRDKSGEWINFATDIRWSLNAPIGHLPLKTAFAYIPPDKKRDYYADLIKAIKS